MSLSTELMPLCMGLPFPPKPPLQIIYGALVGGPAGPGDDTYYDVRNDYVRGWVGGGERGRRGPA